MPRSRSDDEVLATHPLGWHERASCREDPDLFVYEKITSRTSKKEVPQAIAICKFSCPVLFECRSWSNKFPKWTGVVIGGVYYDSYGKRYEL